jgi:hypothetical protein
MSDKRKQKEMRRKRRVEKRSKDRLQNAIKGEIRFIEAQERTYYDLVETRAFNDCLECGIPDPVCLRDVCPDCRSIHFVIACSACGYGVPNHGAPNVEEAAKVWNYLNDKNPHEEPSTIQ